MNPEMDKVLARVRKMMALANDAAATEGERDNALRMAHATLAKYNLTMAEAEAAGVQKAEARSHCFFTTNDIPWIVNTCNSVAGLFFCNYFYTRRRGTGKSIHSFIGREGNAAVAMEMAQYVLDSIRREARKASAGSESRGAYERNFAKGASHQVMYRCAILRREAEQEARPTTTGTSIVLASFYKSEREANDKYIAEGMGLTLSSEKSREQRAGEGYREGSEHGKKINLSRQIGSAKPNSKQLN